MTRHRDDWDNHWERYSDYVSESPASEYRNDLAFSLLGIQGDGSEARILDIGSGTGEFAARLLKRLPAATIAGLELSQTGVEVARGKVPAARFFQCDLLQPAAVPDDLNNWATHAVCSEVLEHLDQPETLLRNIKGYLAPGCRLIVTVPGGPMSAFDKHIGHRRHYSPEMMSALLRQSGFQPQQANGAGFPFFNLYRSVVILRGDRLIEDVASDGRHSALALFVMRVFKLLFRFNVPASRWGWQTVVVAQ